MEETRPRRILSIDQFRGYTIFGMILVNYLGEFPCMPEAFRHHSDYITYADTIAPIFLFVAGMGFRLSFLRHAEKEGAWPAILAGARRYAILTVIGILYYSPLDWRGWWDALVDIGFSGLLALPFVGRSARVRVAAAFGYMALYQGLFSLGGYGEWTMAHSFDGGPLGPLSWVFSLLFGTLAYDLIAQQDPSKIIRGCVAWGLALVAIGWAFHPQWGSLKVAWAFSQKSMALPYPVLATGLAFLTFLLFYVLSDLFEIEIPTFTMVGANPLVIYMLHGAYIEIHKTIVPEDSSVLVALLGFAGLYTGCYLVARYLYQNKMFVKI